jgi:metallo-beta-lactamase family protein
MKISFHGAVESVTGSCHLIEFNNKKVMLDCGQFQGSNREEKMNFDDFDFVPSEIDYLLLSHCHIDHCGRIPLLVKRGFKGEIICTQPTYDLCKIMLLDSAHIHESEAEWENRKGKRAGKQVVEPLYTQEDASYCMKYFKPKLYGQMIKVDDDFSIRFLDGGHILGSAIIEMWMNEGLKEEIKIVYSGDLGVENKPLLNNPSYVEEADYVIMESTYGNRVHQNTESKMDKLIDIIINTARKGGNVVIPSFAVGRTQEIIYELNKYYDYPNKNAEELRKIPVYIDSPLAAKTTEVFKSNSQVFDEETRKLLLSGDNPLNFKNLNFVQSSDESKLLNEDKTPKIIIAASGMCEAGRIKHHLKHNLWREESSIVFVGYQAENTLGRKIRDGEKLVKIFGEEINVSAQIYDLEGFSGHADKNGLMKWIGAFKKKPKKVFIVHGENDAKAEFAKAVEDNLSIECIVPQFSHIYELDENKIFVSKNSKDTQNLSKSIQPADTEKIDNLLKDIDSVKKLFNNALNLTQGSLNYDVNAEKYNDISNRLIELENALMNLTILAGR